MTGDPWRPADESGVAPAPQGSYGEAGAWSATPAADPYPQQAWNLAPAPDPYAQQQGWDPAAPTAVYPAEAQPTQLAHGYPPQGQQPPQQPPFPPQQQPQPQDQWPTQVASAWPDGSGAGYDQQPTQVASAWPGGSGAGYDQQPTQLAPAWPGAPSQAPQTPQAPAPQAPAPSPQQPASRLAQNWGAPASAGFSQPAGYPAAAPSAGYQATSVMPSLPGYADPAAAGPGYEDERGYPDPDRGRGPVGNPNSRLPRFVREHPTEVGLGAAVVVASLVIVGVLSLGGGSTPVGAQAGVGTTPAAAQSAESSPSPSGQSVVVPVATPSASPSPSASATPTATAAAVLTQGATGEMVNQASGLCLTTSDPAFGQASTIVLAVCGQAPTQEWTYSGSNQLTENNNAGCLDAYGAGTTAGTEVDLYSCNGGTNQQWTLLPDGTVVGQASNLCVSPVGDGTTVGTQVVLETCDGTATQHWN